MPTSTGKSVVRGRHDNRTGSTETLKILVTGATGMIGRAVCTDLRNKGYQVIAATRNPVSADDPTLGEISTVAVGEIHGTTSWSAALSHKPDAIVHLASRAHVMHELTDKPLASLKTYQRINTAGTLALAEQARACGVSRFVFISTSKVMGEGRPTLDHTPYRFDDPAIPQDAYAISKWEAEQGLNEIASKGDMRVVNLRPPLVYGPFVKANFLRLIGLTLKGVPLPLGSVNNRRSLIYVGNLVSVIEHSLTRPLAARQTFLVSDADDVSTPELIRRIAAARGRKPLLFDLPVDWLIKVGELLGKRAQLERLLGSFVLDTSPVQDQLGWRPPFSMQQGLKQTIDWYRDSKS